MISRQALEASRHKFYTLRRRPCSALQLLIRLLDLCTSTSPQNFGEICSSPLLSHSAPFAAQYDEPGMPYSRLVELVACPSGSGSFACLQQAPFEVDSLLAFP
jgi:hypothetical protein